MTRKPIHTLNDCLMDCDGDSFYGASGEAQTLQSEAQMLQITWKVGQKVVCDRPRKPSADCYIHSIDRYESITIFCPAANTIVCGQRRNLERLGWRTEHS